MDVAKFICVNFLCQYIFYCNFWHDFRQIAVGEKNKWFSFRLRVDCFFWKYAIKNSKKIWHSEGSSDAVQCDYLVTRPGEKFSKENGLCQAKNYGFVNWAHRHTEKRCWENHPLKHCYSQFHHLICRDSYAIFYPPRT